MTPRQLYALRKRRIKDLQWTELMFSRLTAATCNSGFARPEKPFEDTAFMIHPFRPDQIRRETALPPEPPGDTLLRLLAELPPGSAYRA